MIISIGTENGFENPTLIHYKRPDKLRKKGNSSQHHKGHTQQTCTQHYTKCRKPQNIYTKHKTQQYPLSLLLLNIVLELL